MWTSSECSCDGDPFSKQRLPISATCSTAKSIKHWTDVGASVRAGHVEQLVRCHSCASNPRPSATHLDIERGGPTRDCCGQAEVGFVGVLRAKTTAAIDPCHRRRGLASARLKHTDLSSEEGREALISERPHLQPRWLGVLIDQEIIPGTAERTQREKPPPRRNHGVQGAIVVEITESDPLTEPVGTSSCTDLDVSETSCAIVLVDSVRSVQDSNEDIEVAISVKISHLHALRCSPMAVYSGITRLVGESAITVAQQKHISAQGTYAGYVQVTIPIKISHLNAASSSCVPSSIGLLCHVSEDSCAIIYVQLAENTIVVHIQVFVAVPIHVSK